MKFQYALLALVAGVIASPGQNGWPESSSSVEVIHPLLFFPRHPTPSLLSGMA
jgi:hypothetical protein